MRQDRTWPEPDGPRLTDSTARILVVGIGNSDRGDDAIGPAIARRVGELGPRGVTVGELSGDPLALLDWWHGADSVILIDAVSSGSEAGTVMRFDAQADDLPAIFGSHVSSHGVGVVEVVALAKALDRLPPRLIVYGIEGSSFELGAPLTRDLASVVDITANRIVQESSRKG